MAPRAASLGQDAAQQALAPAPVLPAVEVSRVWVAAHGGPPREAPRGDDLLVPESVPDLRPPWSPAPPKPQTCSNDNDSAPSSPALQPTRLPGSQQKESMSPTGDKRIRAQDPLERPAERIVAAPDCGGIRKYCQTIPYSA